MHKGRTTLFYHKMFLTVTPFRIQVLPDQQRITHNSLQICGELEGMVWLFAQMETNAVSVERLKEYTEIEQEADWTSNNSPPR